MERACNYYAPSTENHALGEQSPAQWGADHWLPGAAIRPTASTRNVSVMDFCQGQIWKPWLKAGAVLWIKCWRSKSKAECGTGEWSLSETVSPQLGSVENCFRSAVNCVKARDGGWSERRGWRTGKGAMWSCSTRSACQRPEAVQPQSKTGDNTELHKDKLLEKCTNGKRGREAILKKKN